MWDLFTLVIYQPFFNILLFFYWFLGLIGTPDMGIAVILLTIVIRVLMLPLSLAGHRSEAERREIAEKIINLERELGHDPVALKRETKKVFRGKRPIVISEMISLVIQVAIALMLWRIFSTGLEGQDLHYIYSFMPEIDFPYNLRFLGKFDLSHSSLLLNFIQSILIFALETLSVLTSPYPPTKGEIVRLQLTLPIVSFIIFMGLPAGKKLFVITTLIFSIILTVVKYVRRRFEDYRLKWLESQQKEAEEKIIVDVK